MSESGPTLTVVLAEDDDGHAALIHRNLVRAGLGAGFLRVHNGLELLNLLERNEELQSRRLVVLLDVRMPHLDGIQTLSRLKGNRKTAAIPVYILTTTDDRRDIEQCFELGCNAYILKPVAYDAFSEAIHRLALFLQITCLPGGVSPATS